MTPLRILSVTLGCGAVLLAGVAAMVWDADMWRRMSREWSLG